MQKVLIFLVFQAAPLRGGFLAIATLVITGCALPPGDSPFTGGGGLGPPRGGGVTPQIRSRLFFESNVKKLFEKRCASCHNDPRIAGDGPLAIYEFSAMAEKLMEGSGAEENSLILKMRNQIPHSGSDQCTAGVDQSPCKEVKEWWALEAIARGSSNDSISPVGLLNAVTVDGQITGWAADVNEPSAAVKVEFYVDGPKGGTGRLIGRVTANQPYQGIDIPGNHGFSFSVPDSLRDRNQHSLYAYALDTANGADGKLSPRQFRVYPLSAAGRNYFNNSVLPQLQSCRGCHTNNQEPMFNYDRAFYFLLLNPTPAAGGTNTNNRFHQKASGVEHSGGNQCGGGNTGPCPNLRTWWSTEFAN